MTDQKTDPGGVRKTGGDDTARAARLRHETNWIITGSLSIIAGVALGMALIHTQTVMIPFVMAVFIVVLVSPFFDFQVLRLRFPRWLAVVTTMLMVLAVTAVIGVLISRSVQTIVATASSYSDSFVDLARQVLARLEKWGLKVEEAEVVGQIQRAIPRFVSNTFGSVFGFVANVTFISIFLMFLLSGRDSHVVRTGVYAEIDQKVRKYITTKLIVSTATGLFVWISLRLFRLQLAEVFGVLAFLLNFIPSIGSIFATLLPIPIAVAQYENPWVALLVVGLVGLVEMIIGNGIEPKVMGRGLHLHPVTVLLALSFWGLLWGLWGMFLAVPMTATIRIVLMQFDRFRPVARLMAGERAGAPEAGASV